jgi:hypothetical protein
MIRKLKFKAEDFEGKAIDQRMTIASWSAHFAQMKFDNWYKEQARILLNEHCAHTRKSMALIDDQPIAQCRECGAKFEAIAWSEVRP